jgi:hypothetical protein
MRRLGQRLEWAADPDLAFPAIAETVAEALRLPYVALEVIDAAGAVAIVAEHGPRQPAVTTLPLAHGAEPVGRLVLGIRSGERGFRADEQGLLEDLARQAGAAIQALRLRADLARSHERLVFAREEERRRLRRDLHDGLGPTLAAIGLRAEASAESLVADPAAARRLLDELGAEVRAAWPTSAASSTACARRRSTSWASWARSSSRRAAWTAEPGLSRGRDSSSSGPRRRSPTFRPRSRSPPTASRSRRSPTSSATPGPTPARCASAPATTSRSRSPTTVQASGPICAPGQASNRCASAPPSWAGPWRSPA